MSCALADTIPASGLQNAYDSSQNLDRYY